MNCSRRDFSVSARSSSDIGGGPSLSSPFKVLKAWGLVSGIAVDPVADVDVEVEASGCGIREERRPVDSSHELAETEVGLAAVTNHDKRIKNAESQSNNVLLWHKRIQRTR